MQEKGVEGKNKIKERFNELSKQVTIDIQEFMKALLKKKEVSTFSYIAEICKLTNLIAQQTKKLNANPSATSPVAEQEENKLENINFSNDIMDDLE